MAYSVDRRFRAGSFDAKLQMDFPAIPLKEISKSKNVAVVVTSRGGHIGFLEGVWPVKEEQYLGKFFSQYFAAMFTSGLNQHEL